MATYLSERELARLRPAETAAFASPVPTQMISNGEFNPLPQTRQQRQVEHYWLCVACAARWTLVYDREHGVALAPVKLSTPAMAAVAQSGVA